MKKQFFLASLAAVSALGICVVLARFRGGENGLGAPPAPAPSAVAQDLARLRETFARNEPADAVGVGRPLLQRIAAAGPAALPEIEAAYSESASRGVEAPPTRDRGQETAPTETDIRATTAGRPSDFRRALVTIVARIGGRESVEVLQRVRAIEKDSEVGKEIEWTLLTLSGQVGEQALAGGASHSRLRTPQGPGGHPPSPGFGGQAEARPSMTEIRAAQECRPTSRGPFDSAQGKLEAPLGAEAPMKVGAKAAPTRTSRPRPAPR